MIPAQHPRATRIAIKPFNEKKAIGITEQISAALIYKMRAHGFQIDTHDCKHADAILTGNIISQSTAPSFASSGATITAYSIYLGIEVSLETRDGEKLWSYHFTARDDFLPPIAGQDMPYAIESRQRLAMHRVSEKAAEQIVQELLTQTYFTQVQKEAGNP